MEDKGSGFNSDTNKITIISKDNKIIPFELKTKSDVALDIVLYLENLLK
jgi:phosphopantothenoylcysteine decarboxylase/phosphopantothenate--cysteine ligase